MVLLKTQDSIARQIDVPGLPKNTYIVENGALEKLLFNRELVGLEFCDACHKASERFLEHISSDLPKKADGKTAELMILSKGKYYFLHNSFRNTVNKNLECNFIATKRHVKVSGIEVECLYKSFLSPADYILVGDTIASGLTARESLKTFFQYHIPKRVFFLTYYGTAIGGAVINEVCEQYNVELFLLYGLALFGLAENGFDLPFLHPDTITAEKYLEKAKAVFHGKQISALGWDFGSQSQSVQEYYRLWNDEKERWGIK